jgi:hypothetical protein
MCVVAPMPQGVGGSGWITFTYCYGNGTNGIHGEGYWGDDNFAIPWLIDLSGLNEDPNIRPRVYHEGDSFWGGGVWYGELAPIPAGYYTVTAYMFWDDPQGGGHVSKTDPPWEHVSAP